MPHSVFFTKQGHAIHGSCEVKRFGSLASHGCVRLAPKNAAKLFAMVKDEGLPNTQVVVTGSEQIALEPMKAKRVARRAAPLSKPQKSVRASELRTREMSIMLRCALRRITASWRPRSACQRAHAGLAFGLARTGPEFRADDVRLRVLLGEDVGRLDVVVRRHRAVDRNSNRHGVPFSTSGGRSSLILPGFMAASPTT